MASENTQRAQGGPSGTQSLRDGVEQDATAAGERTKVRGTLRYEGRFLETYSFSEHSWSTRTSARCR
jgi:hypothetical protein